MKNIIVPIDYSDASLNAASYAAALAKYSNARIILFHAFHLPIHTAGLTFLFPDIDGIIFEHKEKLDAIGKELSNKHGIRVISISRPTFILDELNILVKQYDADLVVMGMRGSSLEYKLFGSITVSAIRQGNFPVLVVPETVKFSPVEKILFACEYSYLSANNKLNILRKIATRFNASIQVLHVESFELVTPSGDPADPMPATNFETLFDGIHHEYKFVNDKQVLKGIERGVREFDADLLAMVPHKLDFWDEIFNNGTTGEVAYHSSVPLLAMPNPDIE